MSKKMQKKKLAEKPDEFLNRPLAAWGHDETSLQQLEFPKILEKLDDLRATSFSQEALIQQTMFSHSKAYLNERLTEVAEMKGLLEAGYHVPMGGFSDIREYLRQIKPQKTFLEADQLLEVKGNLQLMGEVGRFFKAHQPEAETLFKIAMGIHDHREVIQRIDAVIDISGEIHDNATPELRRIRIKIRSLESDQKKVLWKMQKRYAEYSQDDIVTLRDGRMVLGILPNYINKVNGIVHGSSGSGATVFVEPMETLQISNQIQNLKVQERSEILNILRSVTDLLREAADDIRYGIENIALLDIVLAKARLARQLDAVVPQLIDEPRIKLSDARHPLLVLKMGNEKVVPFSLELGDAFGTLVITGPNAGGKTVAMKTVGLCLLMTQMGMLIPANPDSEIPLLSRILVDIGDRQSLEQDLSTFSAHILRLKEILAQADQHSLVLLDEAGTGTDPKEGAALATAMLAELTRKQILTIATTHHGELKAFAHTRERIENASMEFDLNTLEPTYVLRIGIPGSSYAFEIARRYGFSEKLIQEAQHIIGAEKDSMETLILNLEKQLQENEEKYHQLSIRLSEAEGYRELYRQQNDKLKNEKVTLKRQAAEEAQQILKQANALIENTVREIRQKQADKDTVKAVREKIQEQKNKVATLLEKDRAADKPVTAIEKGDIVLIEALGERGEVLEIVPEKGKISVLIRNVKMVLELNGIRKLQEKTLPAASMKRRRGAKIDQTHSNVGPELDLRGLDGESAVEATDRYLSDVLETGWEEVRIIHGKGTGILRKIINQFLSRDRRVLEKRLGKWGEGDTGVTVVKLKY